jgi:hypothetical protein
MLSSRRCCSALPGSLARSLLLACQSMQRSMQKSRHVAPGGQAGRARGCMPGAERARVRAGQWPPAGSAVPCGVSGCSTHRTLLHPSATPQQSAAADDEPRQVGGASGAAYWLASEWGTSCLAASGKCDSRAILARPECTWLCVAVCAALAACTVRDTAREKKEQRIQPAAEQ